MPDKVFNVLFICTGNSARSVLAEGLLNAAITMKRRLELKLSLPLHSLQGVALHNPVKNIATR